MEDAESLLIHLHDTALIQFDAYPPSRYFLLPIVREYALEKASDTLPTYRELYVEFYKNMAMRYDHVKDVFVLSDDDRYILKSETFNIQEAIRLAEDFGFGSASNECGPSLIYLHGVSLLSSFPDMMFDLEYVKDHKEEYTFDEREKVREVLQKIRGRLQEILAKSP